MRVRKSAIGSVTEDMELPAGLGEAGDVPLGGHLAQADPAEAELAEVSTRAAAAPAAIVVTGLELGSAPLADYLAGFCHLAPLLLFARVRGVARRGSLALGVVMALVRLWVVFLQLLQCGLLGLGLGLALRLSLLLLAADVRSRALVGALERHPERLEQRERLFVGSRRRGDVDVEAANLVDCVVVDLREDDLLADA